MVEMNRIFSDPASDDWNVIFECKLQCKNSNEMLKEILKINENLIKTKMGKG